MTGQQRHVAIVAGGTAQALADARDIADALIDLDYAVTPIDEDGDLVARLLALKPDIVFNATGRTGNGRLQGVCELLGLPYTHSGIAAGALAADRHLCKMVFKSAGIPVTDHVLVDRAEAAASHVLPPPYVAKPRHCGTGGEPVIVRYAEDPLPEALLGEDWARSDEVLVERFLPGMTLTAFVMGNVMLGIAAKTDETKNSVAETLIPAPISPKIYEDGTRLALKAYGVLGCRGVTALTLRVNDRQGYPEPVALGFSTQPELGRASPLARIAARAGHEYGELLRWIVENASFGTRG